MSLKYTCHSWSTVILDSTCILAPVVQNWMLCLTNILLFPDLLKTQLIMWKENLNAFGMTRSGQELISPVNETAGKATNLNI